MAVTVLMGVSEVITRIGCAFLLPGIFGYRGLWFVSPITWIFAALVGAVRYYSGGWERKASPLADHARQDKNSKAGADD